MDLQRVRRDQTRARVSESMGSSSFLPDSGVASIRVGEEASGEVQRFLGSSEVFVGPGFSPVYNGDFFLDLVLKRLVLWGLRDRKVRSQLSLYSLSN